MDQLQKLMSKIATSRGLTLQNNGNYCFKHIPIHVMPKETSDHEMNLLKEKYKVPLIIFEGIEECPRCSCEKEDLKLKEEMDLEVNKQLQNQKLNTMHEKSLFQDETIKYVKFDTYQPGPLDDEAHENKNKAVELTEKFKQGYQFNIVLSGNVGVGKSGLAVSILKELRNKETSCLFISTRLMFEKIFDSFNNKESKYTPEYFRDLISDCDYVVLDDLGAETGNTDSNKKASDYVSKYLCGLIESRQHKSTIYTTNLSMVKLIEMYDERLVDRMCRNIQPIKFLQTKSFRNREELF